jgi:hypothetical protein
MTMPRWLYYACICWITAMTLYCIYTGNWIQIILFALAYIIGVVLRKQLEKGGDDE